MSYIVFVTLLLAAISGILSLYRHVRKLQQGSYLISKYFKWLMKSYTTEFALSAILYCAISICLTKEQEWVALILAIVLVVLRAFLVIATQKNTTKKLAFTAQVKAIYITAILILGALVMVSVLSTDVMAANVCRTIGLLLSIIMPVLVFVVWTITYPLVKFVFAKKESKTDDIVTD